MGKNKYIESPDKMWELFTTYKNEVKQDFILVQDFVGKDGDEVNRKRERPLTLEGFECWCFDNDIISDLSQYFANTEGRYKDYQTICSRIRKSIRRDQIEGGMAGIYNPSITQRLNGLVDKIHEDGNKEVKITVRGDRHSNKAE
jgi:hypothetical protein